MTTRTAVAGTIVAAAALAAAGPIAGQMTHPGGGSTGHEVTINDAGYRPAEMVVAPGQQVTWTNTGVQPHTVTADAGAFDSGTMDAKAKFTITAPAASGTFTYHCTFHTYMRGSLVVSSLTLQGPKSVAAGKAATVRGTAPGMAPGTPVALESLTRGAWTQVAAGALAGDATYRLRTPALTASAQLRARIGAEVSPTLAVPVAPKVVVTRAKKVLKIKVTPARAGRARLERLNTNTFRWTVARNVRIAANGRAKVTVTKAGSYRVTVLPAKGMAAGTSRTLKFR
ncbi:cupredoxin domain-containing protein [Miltoncostaea marina]|uniref:cupredoxin domain-containing protein n=1 Tax=Miltoncostaea marina TaxID=2843215 RepID=UPI001C3C594B|nr:cupredoxin domain-containing protein [Miltoncostaea marina]